MRLAGAERPRRTAAAARGSCLGLPRAGHRRVYISAGAPAGGGRGWRRPRDGGGRRHGAVACSLDTFSVHGVLYVGDLEVLLRRARHRYSRYNNQHGEPA